MLTLSRYIGECVLIGDDIEVYLVDAGRGQAKLAIRAPRQVKIIRKELSPVVGELEVLSSDR